eukprot:11755835-Alexandrium_andersonii.AAC.1
MSAPPSCTIEGGPQGPGLCPRQLRMELGGLGSEEATAPLGFLLSQLREPVRRVSDPSPPELSPGPA